MDATNEKDREYLEDALLLVAVIQERVAEAEMANRQKPGDATKEEK